MNSDMSTGELVSEVRLNLAGLLDAMKRLRADYEEVLVQQRRLDSIKQAETSAKAKLEAITARDVREMSEQLLKPTDLHVMVDHGESTEAERGLARATREADVARACEPEVRDRLAKVGCRLAEIGTDVMHRVADVALEEAVEFAREIDEDAARLRAKYARLWGLWAFLSEAKLYRHAERVAKGNHPDNVCPSDAEVHGAAPIWRNFTERLATDPAARLEDRK